MEIKIATTTSKTFRGLPPKSTPIFKGTSFPPNLLVNFGENNITPYSGKVVINKPESMKNLGNNLGRFLYESDIPALVRMPMDSLVNKDGYYVSSRIETIPFPCIFTCGNKKILIPDDTTLYKVIGEYAGNKEGSFEEKFDTIQYHVCYAAPALKGHSLSMRLNTTSYGVEDGLLSVLTYNKRSYEGLPKDAPFDLKRNSYHNAEDALFRTKLVKVANNTLSGLGLDIGRVIVASNAASDVRVSDVKVKPNFDIPNEKIDPKYSFLGQIYTKALNAMVQDMKLKGQL